MIGKLFLSNTFKLLKVFLGISKVEHKIYVNILITISIFQNHVCSTQNAEQMEYYAKNFFISLHRGINNFSRIVL